MSPLSAYSNVNYNSNFKNQDYNNTNNYEIKKGGDILNYTKNILERSSTNLETKSKPNNQFEDKEQYNGLSFRNKNDTSFNNYKNNEMDVKYNNTNNTINSLHAISSMQSGLIGSMLERERENDQEEFEHERETTNNKESIINELTKDLHILLKEKEHYEQECRLIKHTNNELIYEIKQLKEISDNKGDSKLKHLHLMREYDNLLHHYDKSEKVREEQNKLIKSLQREIDILRDNCLLIRQEKSNEVVLKKLSLRSENSKINEGEDSSSNEIKAKLNNPKKIDKNKKKTRIKIKAKSVDKKNAEVNKTTNKPKKIKDKAIIPKSQNLKLK